MKVPEWPKPDKQMAKIGRHHWSVSRLHELAKNLTPFEAPLDALDIWQKYDLTLREVVMHAAAFMDADMEHPIILDEDGCLMDGRHRIMRAIYEGRDKILVVRFDENPAPCRVDDDGDH